MSLQIKLIGATLLFGLPLAAWFLGSYIGGSSSARVDQGNTDKAAVIIADGSQVIDLTAKGGYFPATVTAKAGIPTTLRVQTRGTYDCSSALTIPSLGVNKMLPATGITSIDIPAQSAGSKLVGTCSMGMFEFTINFL